MLVFFHLESKQITRHAGGLWPLGVSAADILKVSALVLLQSKVTIESTFENGLWPLGVSAARCTTAATGPLRPAHGPLAVCACQTFSHVSALVLLQRKVTIESTFENGSRCRHIG